MARAQIEVRILPVDEIRTDGGTQMRSGPLLEEVARRYAQDVDSLPPADVYDDGQYYWLADGHYRRWAHMLAGVGAMRCRVHQGGLREAQLHAAGSNTFHGLPRTQEDARCAVCALLADEDWRGWSDRAIARQCRVSPDLVAKLRAAVPAPNGTPDADSQPRKFQRRGKTHKMKARAARPKPVPAPEPVPTELGEMRDGLGQVIPERLRAAFADTFLLETIHALDELEVKLKAALAHGAKFLRLSDCAHRKGALGALETLRHAIAAGIPWAVHARCGGEGCHGPDGGCLGTGYVPHWRYEELRINGDW